MSEMIRIQNLYKIYQPGDSEVRALDGITLTIRQGEFVAIIGQSGSGKSTLMNMIGCLDVPTSGDYHLEGRRVALLSDNELSNIRNQHIGFIFQGFNLVPGLTALENVELPLIYRNMRRSERRLAALDSLKKVGLINRQNHRPSQMSGGQQQRVAIARAIAANPRILLADEPTGNLDTGSGREVMRILLDLNAEGRTIILITHDNDIAAMAQRTIHICDGQVVSDTTAESAVG